MTTQRTPKPCYVRLHNLCKGSFSTIEQIELELQSKQICPIQVEVEHPCKDVLVLFNPLLCEDDISKENLFQTFQTYHDKNFYAIAISIGATVPSAKMTWELLKAGACELLIHSQSPKLADTIAARLHRHANINELLKSPAVQDHIIGNSPKWLSLLQEIIEIAHFSQDSLLILGESGTGKELIAKLIHELDTRHTKKDLVLLDCSTITPELGGSEFFGHEKGAFTNAISLREGAFFMADNGTLFLDEIGELPLSLQAELLRVIQEGIYKRVGSNHWKKTNFRLVCATNRNLLDEVKKGRFREDLYYRISTWVKTLPPLRERREDIPHLARFFLKQAFKTSKIPDIDDLVLNFLITRDYPGNIRELRQLMTRIAHRHVSSGSITVGDIPESDRPTHKTLCLPLDDASFDNLLLKALNSGWCLKDIVNHVSDTVKYIAIQNAKGDLQQAAHILNVSDRTMQLYISHKKSEGEQPMASAKDL